MLTKYTALCHDVNFAWKIAADFVKWGTNIKSRATEEYNLDVEYQQIIYL